MKSKTKLANYPIASLNASCLVVEKPTTVVTMTPQRQLCLCPHIRPQTRAGIHNPRPTARFQRCPGREQTTNAERLCGSQGQEREHARVRPARHHSSKEGIPFPSNCLRRSGLPDMCVLGGRASVQVHLQTLCSHPKNVQLMHIVLEVGKILFSRPTEIKYYIILGRKS